jgi:4-amino-4-deoxy-L-arabinose transferase-like glycosyltransferase
LISLAAFSFYVPKYGLIYDGGLYSSLGYSLQNDGTYNFNGNPGDVPPVYPIFLALSIYLFGEKGIFAVTPLFSAIFILIVFNIFRREFDEEVAFLGSIQVLFNPPIFFYAIQVVRDLPLMAFLMLGYFLYPKLEDENSNLIQIALGASMALAFLTKYVALFYFLPLIIHTLINKRPFKIPLITGSIILLPWIAWSYINHGTLLVSHSSYLTNDIGQDMWGSINFLSSLLWKWSFPPFLLLSLLGFGVTLKKKKMNLFATLLILILLIWLLWPEKDIRYLLVVYVLIVYFGLIFLNRFDKCVVILFLLITLLATGNTTYKLVEANTYQNLLFKEAGHWLNENTPEDARILAHSHRQVNFFSHRMTYQPAARGPKR